MAGSEGINIGKRKATLDAMRRRSRATQTEAEASAQPEPDEAQSEQARAQSARPAEHTDSAVEEPKGGWHIKNRLREMGFGKRRNPEAPPTSTERIAGMSEADHVAARAQIEGVIKEEIHSSARQLLEELKSNNFIDQARRTIASKAGENGDASAIAENISDLETQYIEALESGNLSAIAATNPIAKIAVTRAMQDMQSNVQRRLAEIKLMRPTPKIGRHADFRNVPVTSLLEYVRFLPELGIAFIAGNSAKNMVAELLSQAETTAGLGYENRLLVASAAGIGMSWMAYQLRHSLYKDAQEHGHTYANLPLPRVTASISAYKNVMKKAPITTTLRTGMAIGVALAGGNVLLNLAGASGKSVEFGKTTINIMDPLNKEMLAAGSVMETFLKQVDERCQAIVNAEVNPALAGKGTGKGATPNYGPKAAAKDYLCFGTTKDNKQPPATLVTFRQSINLAPGVSISDLYRKLWNERSTQRQALFNTFTTKLKALQELVQAEADVPFATRVEQATLKHIPENKIPGAKAELISAIEAYMAEINAYSEKVDAISGKIATEGLAAANAAGQGIDIIAPRVTIDVTKVNVLPTSPVGKTGFFLSPALAKGAKDTLSRVPGVNFITPMLSEQEDVLALQLMALGLLVYLGAENIPNAFFTHRERMRSRRLKREMGPKQRDYYLMLDKLAENIADIVTEVIAPYKEMMAQQGDTFQSREQLISAIKFAIVSIDPEETPDGSEHPLYDWGKDRATHMAQYVKHLYDWGPDDAAELDQAIGRVTSVLKKFQKGSLQDNAKLLAKLGVPGADVFNALFDPEISKDPEKFAETVRNAELKSMQHSVRYLVLKMQARQFVIDRIASQIKSDHALDMDPNHSEQVRDSLGGIILRLDGSGSKLAVSADEVRYYRVWAALASEQEQDQRNLLQVALAGRTYWDRRFNVDQGLGTVQIPEEFRQEFVASATENPVGEAALLVASYQQMLDRMLGEQGDVHDFTDVLDTLNAGAVKDLKRSLEDEDRLEDKYGVDFACVFSTKHGGPVIRCDLSDAESGIAAASIEAPFIVGDGNQSDNQFNETIQSWFDKGGKGRLEVIARAKHFELQQFLLQSQSAANSAITDGKLNLNDTTDGESIRAAQRELLYRTISDRQRLRLDSLLTQTLQDGEMPLFDLSKKLYTPNLTPQEISKLSGVSVDGLFQIEKLVPLLHDLPAGTSVHLDIDRRMLVVTRGQRSRRILSRRVANTPETFPLSSLNQLNRLEKAIRSGE